MTQIPVACLRTANWPNWLCVCCGKSEEDGYANAFRLQEGVMGTPYIAAQCGYKLSEIEASDVSMFTSIMGYAITGKSLEELETSDGHE